VLACWPLNGSQIRHMAGTWLRWRQQVPAIDRGMAPHQVRGCIAGLAAAKNEVQSNILNQVIGSYKQGT